MDAATPARLMLIRHGRPENHRDGVPDKMSGWTDFPLSEIGRTQVRLLAARFRDERTVVDALYSSPLKRAASTAEALRSCSRTPTKFLDGLKEINCGEVDGMLIREVQRSYPDIWEENLRQDNEDFRWPGGESYREFRMRCLDSVEKIAFQHPGQRVAIATHAGFISQIAGVLHGLSPAQWEPYRPETSSVNEFEWGETAKRMLIFDDQRHLRQAGGWGLEAGGRTGAR